MSVLKSKSRQFLFMRASTHLCGSSFLFPKTFNALSVDELVSFGLVGDLRIALPAVNNLAAGFIG